VEFGLTLPVFLMLVFGTLDLGRAIVAYNLISEGARAGARAGYIQQTAAAVSAAVSAETGALGPGVQVQSAFCTSNPESCSPSDTLPYVRVTVSVPYEPMVGQVVGGTSITLRSTCQMYLP